MRAALYERVSTEEQRDHGLSLDAQREVLEEYVRTHGMTVAGHYTDAGVRCRAAQQAPRLAAVAGGRGSRQD